LGSPILSSTITHSTTVRIIRSLSLTRATTPSPTIPPTTLCPGPTLQPKSADTNRSRGRRTDSRQTRRNAVNLGKQSFPVRRRALGSFHIVSQSREMAQRLACRDYQCCSNGL
jgi:hypothetical protein